MHNGTIAPNYGGAFSLAACIGCNCMTTHSHATLTPTSVGSVASTEKADLSVAIVSHNTCELLGRCLSSAINDGATSIIVVDNASTDGSAEMVRNRFPQVQLVANDSNNGYGSAANQAVRLADAPWVLLLNADTELKPGCLAALADEAGKLPHAGIISPAILDRGGEPEPSCFPFPGTMGWLLENQPLATLTKHIPGFANRSVTFKQHDKTSAVPWVTGCAMMLRREAMLRVGGFDENYFMYFEEVELCHRMAGLGWGVFIAPAAQVSHVGGASTSQYRSTMLISHFESTLKFHRQHYSGARLAFWIALLRTKRAALLLRDSALLSVTRDAEARERLKEQRRAWLAGLAPDSAATVVGSRANGKGWA